MFYGSARLDRYYYTSAISKFDHNNDGFLTLGEIEDLIGYSFNNYPTNAKGSAVWIIKALDSNGDGKLTNFEVLNALK